MAELAVTFIDVGWGDSVFVETTSDTDDRRFALVDCNDYEKERSSLLFVKRFLHRARINFDRPSQRPVFEWVLLTHGHADHARGLKRMLQTFGTRHLWYPKSDDRSTCHAYLLDYAARSSNVQHHQAIDESSLLNSKTDFGHVNMRVLWPERNKIDYGNENNNSVVLALTLADVTFVLTGDAEAANWPRINNRIPATVQMFQVPHHGASNGLFTDSRATPWLDQLHALNPDTRLALSCHIRPHGHPRQDVIDEITDRDFEHFRTDQHYHLTFRTDGKEVDVIHHH
jgi:beta-lactamase superfamily II metal-dependent hydrolase